MLSLRVILLLGTVYQTYAQWVGEHIPEDAKSLPKDCQDSIFNTGMTAEFKNSTYFSDTYDVVLKVSTTAKDLAAVLSTLQGVNPSSKYDTEFDRGFRAKLSYSQVCALDKDPRVRIWNQCK
jgi:hypothetical protein